MFACLYRPPAPELILRQAQDERPLMVSSSNHEITLDRIARDYSPRYECHGADAVVLDVSGMTRLFGSPRTMADEMRRDAASRGARISVAMAGTRTAARLVAHAHVGVTVIMPGDEAD